MLVSVLGEKKTTVVFFLDKDVDDLSRTARRSAHTIYSRYYDLYNEVFRHGNLLRATACTTSIEEGRLTSLIPDPISWCSTAAYRWHDWLVLCLISFQLRIPHEQNFRVPSRIQCKTTGFTDPVLLSQAKSAAASRLGLSADEFQKVYEKYDSRVRRYFRQGRQDIVFKGKWYPLLLEEDIRRLMGNAGYIRDGFVKNIVSSIVATLSFRSAWASYYCDCLRRTIGNRLMPNQAMQPTGRAGG